MRPTIFLLLLPVIITASSCKYIGGKSVRGDGIPATEERQVGKFTGVRVRGSIDVMVSPGTANSLKIEADQNLLDYIEVENKGGLVEVSTRRGYNLRPRSGVKVYATAPSFSVLEVSGSGDIKSGSRITGDDNLEVGVSGSGDVQLDVDAPKVDAEISCSGSVSLNGETQNFEADINGSGDVHSFNLRSENTSVHISGSGNAEVFASKQLSVQINGSGDVRYKGTAAVNQKVSGSGNIRKVD